VKRVALAAAAALAAGALLGTPGGASASSGVSVTATNGPPFPVRTFVLSLPNTRQLRTRDIRVTENGSRVLDPTVTPASRASKKAFGVVLLLDTSFSMTGKPLAAALSAAQTFIAQRNRNEQLGAIDFNHKEEVVLPLTTSSHEISGVFASLPRVHGGTHIYDAVARAEAMLKAAHINSGSIVVLSDGADTGSKATRAQVVHSALANNTRIYTIGLRDAAYKPATLKALAASGHGQYAETNAQALAPLFDQLGQTLSNEYLLRYKSFLGPNKPVRVDVSVRGVGASTADYRTPAINVGTVAPTFRASTPSGFWGSALAIILIALLAGGVIAILVIGLLRPRRSALPVRMAEFVSIPELQRDRKGQGSTSGTSSVPGVADAPMRKSAWARFEETLEIADIKMEPELIVAATFGATGLVFLLIYVGTGSLGWALFALGVPYIAREWVLRTLKRRRERFAEQLPDALQVVASALRSGHSFAGALAVVVDSGSEPMKSEMQRVVADEQLGVPIQDSLAIVAQRMASREVEQLALVAELQREAGGNAAEVIDQVAETVRERFDLKRLIKTLTTQGRMSRAIVSALPVFIFIVIRLENPNYFHPLTSTVGGRVVLGLAAVWAVLGSLVIKRIVEIEV
jgi:tight adherence protein B